MPVRHYRAMKLTLLVAVIALAGCGKKDSKDTPAAGSGAEAKPAPPPPPKPAGRKLPNSSGTTHVVDAPAKWLDNGVGGAEGMHLDGEAGDFHLTEVTPEEAKKTLEQKSDEIEQVLFEKWVSSKQTKDGFELIYVLDKMKMEGDKMKKDGTTFGFDVRLRIQGKLWTCSGAASTKEIADEAVGLCNKITNE